MSDRVVDASDPSRLLDGAGEGTASPDAELANDLRRAAGYQPAIDVEAGLARLQAAIDAEPPPGGGGPGSGGPAGGTPGAPIIAAGLALVAVLGGLGGWAMTRLRPSEPAADAGPSAATAIERPAAGDPSPPQAPASAAAAAEASGGFAAEASAIAADVDEIQLLARMRRALAEDAPALAVALGRAGDQRFGDGVLGEEREALSIVGLGRLGRTGDTVRRARAFLEAHPESPLRDRVRAALDAAQAETRLD